MIPGDWEKPKRAKYGNAITVVDGIKFHSKKEANHYAVNQLRVREGELLYFLRQVPIYLPGGVKYVCDFVEFTKDGQVKYVDTKGHRTRSFIDKKKMVEALYPIKIREV